MQSRTLGLLSLRRRQARLAGVAASSSSGRPACRFFSRQMASEPRADVEVLYEQLLYEKSKLPTAPFLKSFDQAIHTALDKLELQETDIFMDIGCGDGKVLQRAAARGSKLVGLEVQKELCESCVQALEADLAGNHNGQWVIFQARFEPFFERLLHMNDNTSLLGTLIEEAWVTKKQSGSVEHLENSGFSGNLVGRNSYAFFDQLKAQLDKLRLQIFGNELGDAAAPRGVGKTTRALKIYFFLDQQGVAQITPYLEKMPSGTRVASLQYPVENSTEKIRLISHEKIHEMDLYLYEVA